MRYCVDRTEARNAIPRSKVPALKPSHHEFAYYRHRQKRCTILRANASPEPRGQQGQVRDRLIEPTRSGQHQTAGPKSRIGTKLPSRVVAFGDKADIGHSAAELTKSGHANLTGNASKSCVRAPGGWRAVIGRAASPSEKTARGNIVPQAERK